jgi:hypothetical protein
MRLRLAIVVVAAMLMSSTTISGGDVRDIGDGPCQNPLDTTGKTRGLHKKCSEGGGSSGVARGDFNSDGIGDLAIGTHSKTSAM